MRSWSADEAGQDVQQRRLARAGAAADQHVHPRADAVRQEVEHRLRHRLERDEVGRLQPLLRKAPDREQRAVHGERRDDRVDARSVREPGVDHRRAVVDAAADPADDPVDHAQQVAVVLERRGHFFEDAAALDEDVLVGVDQDVVHRRIAKNRFERPEAEHLVDELAVKDIPLSHADRHALFAEQLADERLDLAFGAGAVGVGERFEVEAVQQLLVNVGLELNVAGPRRLDSGARRTGQWWTVSGGRSEGHRNS